MRYFVLNNSGFQKNGFASCQFKGKVWTAPALKCPNCGNFLTSLEWLPPYDVKLSNGILSDVIFGTINPFIVSQKFKEIYEQNNCSGIESFSTVIAYQKGKYITQKYYYPKIKISDVRINLISSNVILEKGNDCSVCQRGDRIFESIDRLVFENEEIITEDIFGFKLLSGEIVVSENFKKLTECLSNITFTEASDFSIHF